MNRQDNIIHRARAREDSTRSVLVRECTEIHALNENNNICKEELLIIVFKRRKEEKGFLGYLMNANLFRKDAILIKNHKTFNRDIFLGTPQPTIAAPFQQPPLKQ